MNKALHELTGDPQTGGSVVLVAVLSKNRNLMTTFVAQSTKIGGFNARQFVTTVDLIRHMLYREAIDLVVVDADTHLDAIARLSAWKASQRRKDFAILVVAPLLRPDVMARALELGGDDIIAGTFDINEFATRAARCLARLNSRTTQVFRIERGGYVLDRCSQCVMLDGVTLLLTAQEFKLAWLFFSAPGVLISRPRIAAEVWHAPLADVGYELSKRIHKLRRKLRFEKGGAIGLRAMYSTGYRLEVSNYDQVDSLDAASGFMSSFPRETYQ